MRHQANPLNYNRPVGGESRRTHEAKLKSGFYDTYMAGCGLDIGYSGYLNGVVPILEGAIGIDTDYPSYNGIDLPFEDKTQDYVYSSHCLEHIDDLAATIKEWYRVLKVNGYLIIVVPHMYLYEKKADLPSNWNRDHKHFFTPGSLLIEIENALVPNSYRARLLEDGDLGFNYALGPNTHSDGQYEITLIIQKIQLPGWKLD